MKNLLKIVVVGFLAFMVLAIAQEWEFFSTAWFGEQEEAVLGGEGDEEQAVDAVRLTLSLMRHFYSSGADPRFAERMPAAEGLVAEMRDDIEYLRRNHRRQEPQLLRLEVLDVEFLADDRAEIQTREFWRFDIVSVLTGEPVGPPRTQIQLSEYLVQREGAGWQVEGWRLGEGVTQEAEGE